LPIPIIFIREKTDLNTLKPKRQIVDGQQRIRTLLSYIDAKSLADFRKSRDFFQVRKVHNPQLSGKNFDELSEELKQRILDYQFSVHILPSNVDDKQVLQIFARMNSTGVRLNGQELRNATYFGPFKETMYSLAYEQLERWRKWGIFSEDDIARMAEVEITSDFALLMYKGISTKSKSSVDKLYKDHDEKFREKAVIKDRFRSVMDSLNDKLGTELTYMEFKKKTLFYALFALVYDLHYVLKSPLVKRSREPIPRDFSKRVREVNKLFFGQKVPDKVSESASRRTSIASSRRVIFDYLRRKCISD